LLAAEFGFQVLRAVICRAKTPERNYRQASAIIAYTGAFFARIFQYWMSVKVKYLNRIACHGNPENAG
jgi:hypothetical protein